MPGAIAGPLVGLGSSVAGGLLGGPSQKSGGTSTTNPIYGPGQQDLIQKLYNQYLGALKMGPQVQQADRDAMMTQINRSYAQAQPQLESSLTARGFGSSGSMGKGFEGLDVARLGQQSQGNASLAQNAMQRWLGLIGLGQGFTHPVGSTTTQTGNVTSTPGLGGVVGGAGQDLGQAMWLMNQQQQGQPSTPPPTTGGYNPSFGGI